MTNFDGPTGRLGRFASEWSRKPLPPAVAEKAALVLLDGMGLALLAAEERTAAAVRSIVSPVADAAGSARVWVDGKRFVLDMPGAFRKLRRRIGLGGRGDA